MSEVMEDAVLFMVHYLQVRPVLLEDSVCRQEAPLSSPVIGAPARCWRRCHGLVATLRPVALSMYHLRLRDLRPSSCSAKPRGPQDMWRLGPSAARAQDAVPAHVASHLQIGKRAAVICSAGRGS